MELRNSWSSVDVASWDSGVMILLGIRSLNDTTFLMAYTDLSYQNYNTVCKIYNKNGAQYTLQSSYNILQGITGVARSGSITDDNVPVFSYSDGHHICLLVYSDTAWSTPPIQVSDTTLHNCINPDIVAENDSTVWVCYQNDGDIYVTRTSVPLGVSGKPTVQIPNAKSKIALSAWPNPANNIIHFSYSLPNTHNSSVSIYDIAGRLVKHLEVKNDQINWNCADNAGHKVASGVYFARLTSDGQETIQRISIIK